jgi:hypothetical protein
LAGEQRRTAPAIAPIVREVNQTVSVAWDNANTHEDDEVEAFPLLVLYIKQ